MENRKKSKEASGKKVLGVEFAPMHLPKERRLQTVAIIAWFLLMFVFTLASHPICIYILFKTEWGWKIVLPYYVWLYWDRQTCNKGGRRMSCTRKWTIWNYYRDYFPIKLVKTADLDPKKNYLFASHPHGILCSGAFCAFNTNSLNVHKLFPGLKFSILTLEINFMFPFVRDLILGFGTCSATRESMNFLLSDPKGGRAAVLIPGGAPESLDSHPGSYVVQLKRRKGFIKVALQNGAALVPVFSFGETEIFDQVSNPTGSLLRRIQDALQNTLQIAPAAFHGRGIFQYSFGLLPYRRPITVVVGAPIEIEKVAQPTQEQIDTLHQKYVDELTELFYAHRDEYASSPNHVLAIV